MAEWARVHAVVLTGAMNASIYGDCSTPRHVLLHYEMNGVLWINFFGLNLILMCHDKTSLHMCMNIRA